MKQSNKFKPFLSLGEKREIFYNFVNSILAGLLVFLGACTDGGVTSKTLAVGGIAALAVAITKFSVYWSKEEKDYKCGRNKKGQMFSFVG